VLGILLFELIVISNSKKTYKRRKIFFVVGIHLRTIA
jgi:hypothetical protein